MARAAFAKFGKFHKVVGSTAYGFAFVSTVDGDPYFDTGDGIHSDHIPVDSIESVSAEFMKASRVGLDMHAGSQVAEVLYAYPMIDDILAANDVTSKKQGLMIGWTTDDQDLLAKIRAGERTGFSIGGIVSAWDIVDPDGNVIESVESAAKRFGPDALAKHAGYDGKDGKLKRRVFRSWKLGEISAVDWPMQAPATIGIVKGRASGWRVFKTLARAITKEAILTSSTSGHQHTLDPTCCDESGEGRTSYERSSGDDYGHDHAWVRNDDGTISIADNSGHGHTVDQGEVANAGVGDAEVPNVAVVVAQRAGGAGNLPRGSAPRSVKATQEQPMDPKDAKIDELTKRRDYLERVVKMSDAQRAYYNRLTEGDRTAFVEKSAADRDREIKDAADADPVVYTSKRTAKVYRESQRELADMAKISDEDHEELAKARAERDEAKFSKIASDTLGHLAFKAKEPDAKGQGGYDDARELVKAIHTITDKETRKRILASLAAADAIAAGNYEPEGVDGAGEGDGTDGAGEGDGDGDPVVVKTQPGENVAKKKLQKMADDLAKSEGIPSTVAKYRLVQDNADAQKLLKESQAHDDKMRRARHPVH